MPKLAQYQQDVIDALRAKLDPKHPAFRGDETIRQALGPDAAGLYIGSWVLPLLDLMERGPRTGDTLLMDHLRRDATDARRALERLRLSLIAPPRPAPTIGNAQ